MASTAAATSRGPALGSLRSLMVEHVGLDKDADGFGPRWDFAMPSQTSIFLRAILRVIARFTFISRIRASFRFEVIGLLSSPAAPSSTSSSTWTAFSTALAARFLARCILVVSSL